MSWLIDGYGGDLAGVPGGVGLAVPNVVCSAYDQVLKHGAELCRQWWRGTRAANAVFEYHVGRAYGDGNCCGGHGYDKRVLVGAEILAGLALSRTNTQG